MLEIESYSSHLQETWDRFVYRSNNGTIFHTRKFLNYHPSNRFSDHSLIFRKNGKIIALFPAALLAEEDGALLASHPGASFGGFVVPEDINLRRSFDLVENLIEYARAHRFAGIDLTLPPIFYSRKIENYLDFALFKNQFLYQLRCVFRIFFKKIISSLITGEIVSTLKFLLIVILLGGIKKEQAILLSALGKNIPKRERSSSILSAFLISG